MPKYSRTKETMDKKRSGESPFEIPHKHLGRLPENILSKSLATANFQTMPIIEYWNFSILHINIK